MLSITCKTFSLYILSCLTTTSITPSSPSARPLCSGPAATRKNHRTRWQSHEGQRKVGEGRILRWTTYKIEDRLEHAIAFELEHPDRQVRGLRWDSRVDVVRRDTAVALTLRISREATEYLMAPARLDLRRPALIPKLLRNHRCRCGSQPALATASCLGITEVQPFVETVLFDSNRVLPVLVLATPDDRLRPLVDPDACADELAGLAHVAWLDDSPAWDALRQAIGARRSVPRGGARLYWPGFGSNTPVRHPAWLRRTVVAGDGRAPLERRLFEMLSRLSVVRVPRDPVLRELIRAHRDRLRATAGETDELWEELEGIENERARLEAQVALRDESILELREENQRLRTSVEAQARQMGVVESGPVPVSVEVEPKDQIETWEDVKDSVEILSEGESFVLTPNAEDMLDSNPYPHPARMFDHIERLALLADAYHDGGASVGGPIDEVAHTQYGIEIALHDPGLKKGGWTDFEFDGKPYSREPHVKVDDYKNPAECGRIYFALDREGPRFIIDHIGLHP